jgi:hypothetical protein
VVGIEVVELRGRNRGSCRGSECGSRRRTPASKWRAAMVNMRLQSRMLMQTSLIEHAQDHATF